MKHVRNFKVMVDHCYKGLPSTRSPAGEFRIEYTFGSNRVTSAGNSISWQRMKKSVNLAPSPSEEIEEKMKEAMKSSGFFALLQEAAENLYFKDGVVYFPDRIDGFPEFTFVFVRDNSTFVWH